MRVRGPGVGGCAGVDDVMRLRTWSILLCMVTLLFGVVGRCWADTDMLRRNVVYEKIDGKDIAMDIAMPSENGRFPLILCIHGGAWRIGDKSKFTETIQDYAEHGFVAASINYRFVPKYQWPAQIDDARAALQFLKHHAEEFKIDPKHIGGMGESAGAQLVMLLAFQPDPPHTAPLDSTRLQAVVDYYGPVDLNSWKPSPLMEFVWQKEFHETVESMMVEFFGTKDISSPQVKSASPINFVSKDCPPVLTFHGTFDLVVPFEQSQTLHDALRKAGVPATLVPIPNGMHGGWEPAVKEECHKQAMAFFEQYLKGNRAEAVAIQPVNR